MLVYFLARDAAPPFPAAACRCGRAPSYLRIPRIPLLHCDAILARNFTRRRSPPDFLRTNSRPFYVVQTCDPTPLFCRLPRLPSRRLMFISRTTLHHPTPPPLVPLRRTGLYPAVGMFVCGTLRFSCISRHSAYLLRDGLAGCTAITSVAGCTRTCLAVTLVYHSNVGPEQARRRNVTTFHDC